MDIVENMHIEEEDSDEDDLIDDEDGHFWDNWERMRMMAAVQVILCVIWWLKLRHLRTKQLNVSTCQENESSNSHSHMSVSSKGKRKASTDDGFGREYEELKSGIKNVSDAIMMGNTIIERRNKIAKMRRPRIYSEREIFDELEKLAVGDQLLFRAYDLLCFDPKRARKFFGCPVGKRKNYLLHMMFSSHNNP